MNLQDWRPGTPLRTGSERFTIRSLGSADVTPAYTAWWNDAELQRGFNMPARGWGAAEALRHVSRFDNRSQFHLGIFPHGETQPIGFFTILANPQTRVAVTNVLVGDRSWWGRRAPLEVRRHLLPFIFGPLGMEKVKGTIHGRNLPSIFNYEAAGFRCEGVLRSELPAVGGGRADIYVYGLLKEEWLASGTGGADEHG